MAVVHVTAILLVAPTPQCVMQTLGSVPVGMDWAGEDVTHVLMPPVDLAH